MSFSLVAYGDSDESDPETNDATTSMRPVPATVTQPSHSRVPENSTEIPSTSSTGANTKSSSLFSSLPTPSHSKSGRKGKKKKKKKKHKHKSKPAPVSASRNTSDSTKNHGKGEADSEQKEPQVIPEPGALFSLLPAPQTGPDIREEFKPTLVLNAPKKIEKKSDAAFSKPRDRRHLFRKKHSAEELMGSFAVGAQSADSTDGHSEEAETRASKRRKKDLARDFDREMRQYDTGGSEQIPSQNSNGFGLSGVSNVIDVNASDLNDGSFEANRFRDFDSKPKTENVVRANFWDAKEGKAIESSKPSRVHKRKHQINSLAFQAQERELELMKMRAKNFRTKRESMAKYGW
eukprot:104234_1